MRLDKDRAFMLLTSPMLPLYLVQGLSTFQNVSTGHWSYCSNGDYLKARDLVSLSAHPKSAIITVTPPS